MYGEIKIIGGRFRGKKLKVLDCPDLRPTPNRIREAIFNSLQHVIPNASCLDAFAGSGAMGLEALSRGAKDLVFIEQNPAIYAQLLKNIADFPLAQIQAYCQDTLEYLASTTKTFDLIFLDPPFHQELWQKSCQWIKKRKLLSPGGILYLESPHPIELSTSDWQLIKTKQMAKVYYSTFLAN